MILEAGDNIEIYKGEKLLKKGELIYPPTYSNATKQTIYSFSDGNEKVEGDHSVKVFIFYERDIATYK